MAISKLKLDSLKNDILKHIQAGQFKKAEKLYPRIKNIDVQDTHLWRLFLGIHVHRSNFQDAIHCCKNILKIEPNDFQATYNLAAALQNVNKIDEAILQYENCISMNPQYTNAYINCAYLYSLNRNLEKSIAYYQHILKKLDTPEIRMHYGIALIASDNNENAVQQFKYILRSDPKNKKALFYIAQCYYQIRNYGESERHYLFLLTLDSQDIKVINNLGRLYEENGKLDMAIEKYHQAVKIDSNNATVFRNLGKVLIRAGNLDDAEVAYNRSMEIETEHPETYFNLGKLYNDRNDPERSKEYFTKALSMDIAKHMENPDEFILAVKYFLSNLEDPELFNEDKKAFVADLFDGYAEKFDTHLVKSLQYKTPQIINKLLSSHIVNKDSNTLDLGCGTGLCCEYLKSFSNKITGIDLSSKMIDKAHKTNCYDKLFVGEITEVVNQLNKPFDLIVAADVFVYIGSLEDIFEACNKKMRLDSYFIFSTEHLSDSLEGDFKLLDSGRYKHSTKYLDQLKRKYGFTLIEHFFCVLRKENGKDVNGCISVLKKEK